MQSYGLNTFVEWFAGNFQVTFHCFTVIGLLLEICLWPLNFVQIRGNKFKTLPNKTEIEIDRLDRVYFCIIDLNIFINIRVNCAVRFLLETFFEDYYLNKYCFISFSLY